MIKINKINIKIINKKTIKQMIYFVKMIKI